MAVSGSSKEGSSGINGHLKDVNGRRGVSSSRLSSSFTSYMALVEAEKSKQKTYDSHESPLLAQDPILLFYVALSRDQSSPLSGFKCFLVCPEYQHTFVQFVAIQRAALKIKSIID